MSSRRAGKGKIMALVYKFPAAKIVAQWNEAKTSARYAEI